MLTYFPPVTGNIIWVWEPIHLVKKILTVIKWRNFDNRILANRK